MALKLLPLVFGLILFSGLYLGGCASPIALHRAVIEYDRTVSRIETERLLLNIARTRHHQPIHFTGVSSIATAFDFRVNTGITGVLAKNPSTDSLTLTLGSTVAVGPYFAGSFLTPFQSDEPHKLALLSPSCELGNPGQSDWCPSPILSIHLPGLPFSRRPIPPYFSSASCGILSSLHCMRPGGEA